MSKTVDKILEILDQPLQHSTEHGYPVGSTCDDACWRCGCTLPAPTTLGACARCVEDLQSERPAPRLTDSPVFNGQAHVPMLTIEISGFWDSRNSALYEYIQQMLRRPNVRFMDRAGNTTHPDQYIENPGPERRIPIVLAVAGSMICPEAAAIDARFQIERYRARGYDDRGMLVYVRYDDEP